MATQRSRLLLLSFVLFVWPVDCGRHVERFDARRALDWVETLAADDLEGRRTGTPGGDEAAQLVAEGFRQAGLEPAGDLGTYLHRFTFPSYRLVAPARLSVEGVDGGGGEGLEGAVGAGRAEIRRSRELVYGRDFYFLNGSSTTSGTAEVVFGGYGLSSPQLDELAALDVRGKVVLAIEGLPPGSRLDRRRAANIDKARRARELGAAGMVFFANPDRGSTFPEMRIWVFRPRDYLPGFFIAKVDLPIAQALLGGAVTSSDARPFATGRRLAWQVTVEYTPDQEGSNVLGIIPGSDPALADELVLIGAHYDGGGTDPDGTIYNGAEDNASGAATVVEVARALAAAEPPARSLMFAAWGAEEQGAWGSKRFLEEARWPLDQIVLTLNLDNVGVGDGRFLLYGANNFPEQLALVQAGLPPELWSRFTPRGAGGSDGWTFQVKGIPTLFAHADAPQPHVHTPADDAQTISIEMLETVGRFSEHALLLAASAPAGAYGAELRLARYVWRHGFVIGSLAPSDGDVDWEALRERGFDLVIVQADGEGAAAALRSALPPEVVVVRNRADLASAEEGEALRVLFQSAGETQRWGSVVRVGSGDGVPEGLLDPEADVALVFDAATARPLAVIARLLDAGIEGERVEDILGRLRVRLMQEMQG